MKNRRVLYIGILVALTGLVFSGFAYGYRHFFTPGERIDHITGKIGKELNLDAQQAQVLQEIATAFKLKLAELQGDHEQMHSQAAALVGRDRITSEDVLNLMAEPRRKFDTLATFAAEQFVRFHEVLTPEQRAQLAQAIEDLPFHGSRCRFGQ